MIFITSGPNVKHHNNIISILLIKQEGHEALNRSPELTGQRSISSLILEKIFKGYFHERAWQPYLLCDLDRLNKFLFSRPQDA